MSFFEQAKHKVEEFVGKVEETVGGAVGDQAMEFHGRAHAEHGEAALEHDIEPEEANEMADNEARSAGPSTDSVAARDQEIKAQRTAEEEVEVKRQAEEDDAAQQAQFDDSSDADSSGWKRA